MSGKRENILNKHEAYMLIAKVISNRSKDPNTRVGAVIVSDSDRILSVGYNGFPNCCSDDEFPWERESPQGEFYTKYPYVVHSELNAILNFRGDHKALEGSSLYVTLFPCHECTKAILQSGIKNIYYESDKYKDTLDNRESRRMLRAAGVKVYKLTMNVDRVRSVYDSMTENNLAELNVYNKAGCSSDNVRFCSRCNSKIDISRSKPNYCSTCGVKFE